MLKLDKDASRLKFYGSSALLVFGFIGVFLFCATASAEAAFLTSSASEAALQRQEWQQQKQAYEDKLGLKSENPTEIEILEKTPVSLEMQQAREEMLRERRAIIEKVNLQKSEGEARRQQEIREVQEEIHAASSGKIQKAAAEAPGKTGNIQLLILLVSICVILPFLNDRNRLHEFLNE